MKECFEYKGQWFLPSSKHERESVSGVLTYSPADGILLELFGNLRKNNSPFPTFGLHNEDVIQGVMSDSTEITLFGCLHTNGGGMSFKVGCEIGEPLSSYHIQFMLEGIHAENQETLKFQKIKGKISNLDEWLGISGFSFPNSDDFSSRNSGIVDVRYTLPNQISFEINEKFEGCFNFVLDGDTRSKFQKNVTLNQYVEIIITTKEDCTFNELLDCLSKFQNFLILALYAVPPFESIHLSGDEHITHIGNDIDIPKSIKLFFNQSHYNQIKIKHDHEMLFCYSNINEIFPEIIKKWYEKYDLLNPICGMMFGFFKNDNLILENRFLNLAQSIETFHSRVHNRKKIDDTKFKQMKEEILKSVSSNHHEWLKGQFDFGNNLDLNTRLTEMIDKYANKTLMMLIGDKKTFIKQIKDSRNYYTHYNPKLAKNALTGEKLFHLTEKLKILLVSAFLVEVGFEKEKTDVLFSNFQYHFNHLEQPH